MEQLLQRLRADRDERGGALLLVVIISVFVFSVVLALASSSAMAVKLTANSTSGMKAYAAAEAGRDKLLVSLTQGTCTASGTVAATANTPAYSWQVYKYTATGTEIPSSSTQSGVVAGCPNDASTHILLKVTGRDSRGKTKTITSTYKWNPATTGTPSTTSVKGAIVTGARLVMSNYKIVLGSGVTGTGDIVISSGNFKCEGSGNGLAGGVYVLNGSIEDMQGCDGIVGQVSASGSVSVNKWSGVAVNGNLCSKSSVNNLWVRSTVTGTVRQNAASCPGLTGGWVEYSPSLTGATKYTTNTNSYCNNDNNVGQPNVYYPAGVMATMIKNATTPTVFDMTNCSQMKMLNTNGNLAIKTDITIVSKGFDYENFNVTSADGQPHTFNVVTPDGNVNDNVPTCSGGSEAKMLQVNMSSPITGLWYSPCYASQITGNWRGQIVMGNIQSNVANSTLTYYPVNIVGAKGPGVTTSGGGTTTPAYASFTLLAQSES